MKYKAQRFDSIFYLAKFLNDKEVLREDIICVFRKEHGLIELLYVDWDDEE